MNDYVETIAESVPLDDLLAQLAEECAEVGHAALKLRRARTGTNPTPVTGEQAFEKLEEEISDLHTVLTVLGVCGISGISSVYNAKLKRWAGRVNGGNLA